MHGSIFLNKYVIQKDNTIISRDAPISELVQATAATLRLSNQKNGIRDSLIRCSALEGPNFPVKASMIHFVRLCYNKADKN